MAIAESFGGTVLTTPWQDDVAAARNVSLAAAEGDWVLVLGADELLLPVPPERLWRLLARTEEPAFTVEIRSELASGAVKSTHIVRLFRKG